MDAIDPESTLANALTSMALMAAKLPLTLPTDADCWSTALDLAARGGDGEPLIARIANTMQLETFWLSDAACADLPPTCEIVEPASAFGFDAAGAIIETDAFAVRE